MANSDADLDTSIVVRRYLLGLLVLVLTVFLSNVFGFLLHPERFFDVPASSSLELRLHLLGFFGQLIAGGWLGVALVFDVRRGQRTMLFAWLASLACFFAPMPSGLDDLWLVPILFGGVAALAWLSNALRVALEPHAV